MDVTDGTGPCNPVTATRISQVSGPSYKIAVCLVNSWPSPDGEPGAFSFDLVYDDSLNQCVPVPYTEGAALDGNPDANAGVSVFTSPALGSGYDCSALGFAPPVCDEDVGTGPGKGRAYIGCYALGVPTLPVGDGVSAPIAEVTFRAIASGVDTLSLDSAGAWDPSGSAIAGCPDGPGQCVGGTDKKSISVGVGGIVELPPSAIAAESAAPAKDSRWSLATCAALAGAVVAVAFGGCWCAGRRWRAA
jgi:hypothetical protein